MENEYLNRFRALTARKMSAKKAPQRKKNSGNQTRVTGLKGSDM